MTIAQPDIGHNRVAVALSGGVDSAVAAALLQQQGYQVEGFYMKNWSDEADALYRGQYHHCPWESDVADVTAICQQLHIPFQSINFEKDYRAKVFQYFLDETKAGRTPNPDILCNTKIKFLSFLQHAVSAGFDYVATGHYARLRSFDYTQSFGGQAHFELLKGVDPNKDQSYFIYHLDQSQLSRILFPIGQFHKSEVRQLAEQFHLPVARKPDSQGLCFIGDIDFQTFIRQYIKAEPGPMILTDGTVVGQHQGLAYYTIGQRHGIAIGGTGPYYVVEKRLPDNTLIICQGADHPSLYSSWFTISDEHWISGQRPAKTFSCTVKVRYRSADVGCTVSDQKVTLEQPTRAVTPGQFAVFYNGEVVLGGGVISERQLQL